MPIMEAALKIMTEEEKIFEQSRRGAGFLYVVRDLFFKEMDALEVLKRIEAKLKKESFFFFQKSHEEGEEYKNLETIIGFGVIEKVTGYLDYIQIEKNGEKTQVSGRPYSLISEHLKKYQTFSSEFTGGAFGYFGYESVRSLEPILTKTKGTFSLLGKKPDTKLNFFESFIIFDHLKNKVSFVGGFLKSEDIKNALDKVEKNFKFAQDLLKDLSKPLDQKSQNSKKSKKVEVDVKDLKSSLGRQKYLEGVAQLKSHIAAGDIFQAVLSERFEFELKIKPLEVFENLNLMHPAPYSFYFSSGENIYLGASPEMLLKSKAGQLETHPIAGTRPRGKNIKTEKKLEKQLTLSPKENAEHLMLLDLARNDLGRVSKPGTVKVPSHTQLKKFPGVMHLVSRVTGLLKSDKTSIDALGACFPAGTLSGAPKVKAMELISTIEQVPRVFYGGAVTLAGFNGDLDSCIAIRSLAIQGTKAFIQAGAGVVADSRAESEYEEILHKTKAIRSVIS